MPATAVWTMPVPPPFKTPESVVDPVPPFDGLKVPDKVSTPELVIGPPENESPVVPPEALTEVTVPAPPEEIQLLFTEKQPLARLMP